MKSQSKILIVFLLNLIFSVFEFLGGIITGSVAIVSDAIHDMGDAASIGLAYILERKSTQKPDENFTYGYARYSVIGGAVSTLILLFGSVIVIYNAIEKLINPIQINYDGMIVVAIIGFFVNFVAAYFTHGGNSINQRAINLHMLEDVLGWCVVLIGALIMRFTNLAIIDPLMSIGVAIFILINAVKNFKTALNVFLEKTPHGINIAELKEHILSIDGVLDIHHVHAWSMDGYKNCATMHIVTDCDYHAVKKAVREKMHELGIAHVTIETERSGEHCGQESCCTDITHTCSHSHHHH